MRRHSSSQVDFETFPAQLSQQLRLAGSNRKSLLHSSIKHRPRICDSGREIAPNRRRRVRAGRDAHREKCRESALQRSARQYALGHGRNAAKLAAKLVASAVTAVGKPIFSSNRSAFPSVHVPFRIR